MKLEVIAKDLKDIAMINESVADRIEFCHDLEIGGLTPSYDEISQAGLISKVPVNIMVRPHDRGYVYTDAEFQQMLKDIEYIAGTKAAGIVVGVLTSDHKIDVVRMKEIMALKKDKTVTFHRAFQEVADQTTGLKVLHDLGVNTILTSGAANINESLSLLDQLKAQKLVTILGGGGVDFTNVDAVKKVVDEIHVGTAIRETKSWAAPISLAKISEMKQRLQ